MGLATMSYSEQWDQVYGANQNIIEWPWSDVVSLAHRYCKHLFDKEASILELGCGTGANIPFFQAKGFTYYGIDGSTKIVDALKKKYPKYKDYFECEDFTRTLRFNKEFDLVLDRAAITHNDTESIKRTLKKIESQLSRDGILLAIDWFSTKHMASKSGNYVDSYTRINIPKGQFYGVGNVHFSDQEHLAELFSGYKILLMREKVITSLTPVSDIFSAWDIVAKRK